MKQERGNALVLTAVFLTALLAFAALSIDMGHAYVNRQQIQEAADSGALGAVQTWASTKDATATVNMGTRITSNNMVRVSEIVSITPGVWNASAKTFMANESNFHNNAVPAVRVVLQRQVPTYFARLFVFPTITTRVSAIAIAARATGVFGVMPWAFCQTGNQTPNPCESFTLKFADSGGACAGGGNYGALSLGGSGASGYRENIENGFPGVIRIGDVIPTETGNMVGPTQQGLQGRLLGAPPYNCDPNDPSLAPTRRLAIVIVTTPASSSKSEVIVTDFWVMALDDPQGGQVTGKYVQVFNGTEIDPSKPPTVGVNAVALVN